MLKGIRLPPTNVCSPKLRMFFFFLTLSKSYQPVNRRLSNCRYFAQTGEWNRAEPKGGTKKLQTGHFQHMSEESSLTSANRV